MGDIRISYKEPWLRVHLNSLLAAYRAAPYFDYVYPDLESVLRRKPDTLWELNLGLFVFLVQRLKAEVNLQFSQEYALKQNEEDGRTLFHPKTPLPYQEPYGQVFQEKFGFRSGMSVIDLMMNYLPGAREYLMQQVLQ